jgi:hypothetical protein
MYKKLLIGAAGIILITIMGMGIYQTLLQKNNGLTQSIGEVTKNNLPSQIPVGNLSSVQDSKPITCGDFTIKYDANINQVGLSFDGSFKHLVQHI